MMLMPRILAEGADEDPQASKDLQQRIRKGPVPAGDFRSDGADNILTEDKGREIVDILRVAFGHEAECKSVPTPFRATNLDPNRADTSQIWADGNGPHKEFQTCRWFWNKPDTLW